MTKLYNKVRRGEFTPADATEAWGYNSGSGPVRMKMAALRQFGLLEGKRGDNRKLSRAALIFVIRNQSSREYQEALRVAAVHPPLFAKARETKPNASDNALRQWLLMDENFSDEGASRFVEVFRSTMTLAGLDDSSPISRLEDDEPWDEIEDAPMVPDRSAAQHDPVPAQVLDVPRASVDHTRVPLRLLGGSLTVTIELPGSMTETAWQQLMTMLNALKPGYVVTEEDEYKRKPPVDELDTGQPMAKVVRTEGVTEGASSLLFSEDDEELDYEDSATGDALP